MDLSAIIKAVSAPFETKGLGEGMLDLQPGDKLTGRVISVENNGRVLVDLGRSRVLAQIAFAVKPGQSLSLHVVETGPVLHFRAESPQDEFLKTPVPRTDFSQVLTKNQQDQFVQLLHRLTLSTETHPHRDSLPKDLLQAFSQIRKLFENVPMERPGDQIALWIKDAVEDRGLWFEKRLAEMVSKISPISTEENANQETKALTRALITGDIKPRLMVFKDFLAQTGEQLSKVLELDAKEIDFLRHSVEHLLRHVEQQQERAVAHWKTGETQQVVVHLLPLPNQSAPIELKLYYPGRRHGDEGKRPHHIALLLNLDRLGTVRVDLAMISAKLHISFFVGSEELRACFQSEIQEVEKALTGTFQQLQVDIFVSSEKIAQFHEEDHCGSIPGRVDIKA